MLRRIFETTDDASLLLLRLTAGGVMFPHGAQKVLGWFGGPGFSGEFGAMTGAMHIPAVFAVLAILAEFLGSIGLMVGFLGRVAALGVACVMVVAVSLAHLTNGFFMNWSGTQRGEGFEYHLLMLGITAVIMWRGSGALSLDRLLSYRAGTDGAPQRTVARAA